MCFAFTALKRTTNTLVISVAKSSRDHSMSQDINCYIQEKDLMHVQHATRALLGRINSKYSKWWEDKYIIITKSEELSSLDIIFTIFYWILLNFHFLLSFFSLMKGCSGNELDHSVDSRDSGENDNNELVVDGEITGMEVVGGGRAEKRKWKRRKRKRKGDLRWGEGKARFGEVK